MKYNRIHINHFGRLQNRTVDFQDGIHVIYGPNESGKSTLHAFLEAMLFGMERGRGRAAHTDNYHRYFPEEGSSTYGGVLEFTEDDVLYSIYRNFRKDPTGFKLMDETNGRQLQPSEEEYRHLLAGLTLPLYRNTVSLRQLQAATSSELPEQLRSHIVNLRTTGSGSLDLTKAREYLKQQRRQLEASLDPEAEQQAASLRNALQEESMSSVEDRISTITADELSELEKQSADMAASIRTQEIRRRELLDNIHYCENNLDAAPEVSTSGRVLPVICYLLGIAGFLTCIWQIISPGRIPAFAAAISGILCFLAGFMLSPASTGQGVISAENREKLRKLRKEEEALTEELLKQQSASAQADSRLQELKQAARDQEQVELNYRKKEEALEALQPVLQHNQEIKDELAAVALAQETIDSLAVTAFDSFGKYLQETASRLISQITSGRYTRLMMDDNMHITLEQDHQPVELTALSVSTIDQVYLALRIACIDFFWPEDCIPLLLDESFAMYDTDRIRETLSWLAENYPGQVFLFTCQKRETDILKDARIAHTLIEL